MGSVDTCCGRPPEVRPAVLTLANPRRRRLVQVVGCTVCGRIYVQTFDPYRPARPAPTTTTTPEAQP